MEVPLELLGMSEAPEQPLELMTPKTELPVAPKINPKKEKLEQKSQGKSETKRTVNSGVWDTEKVDPTLSFARDMPEFQRAEQGIKDLDDLIAMEQARPDKSASWVEPLLALTDVQTGSNFRAGYTPKESKSTRVSKLMDTRNKASGEQFKNLMDSVKSLKTGTESNTQNQMMMNELARQSGLIAGIAAGGGGQKLEKSALWDERDRGFAKQMTDYQAGGAQNFAENKKDLTDALAYVNKVGTDAARGLMSQVAAKAGIRDRLQEVSKRVSGVAVQNMKNIFPGAISNEERKFVEELAYDSKASTEENVRKIQRAVNIIDKMTSNMDGAIAYLEGSENGGQPQLSLRGYKFPKMGATPNMQTPKSTGGAGQKSLDTMTNAELEEYIRTNGG